MRSLLRRLSKPALAFVVAWIGSWACTGAVCAQVLFVDDDAPLGGDGQTWVTAYRYLQDALFDAATDANIVEIRVGEGTYRPDQDEAGNVTPGDRSSTFQMRSGLAIRGGYRGWSGGGAADDRDIDGFPTVLHGDLNGDDDTVGNTDNSYHVVTGGGTDPTAVLDGFVITAGHANDSSPNDSGGGMSNVDGVPMVVNCTFLGNSATNGGAMVNAGGGPILINCAFHGNSADVGGALFNGILINPTLTNCVFSGNSANFFGGGMFNESFSNPTLTNCTLSGNTAGFDGGGMYNSFNDATLVSCILWGNSDSSGTGEFAQVFNDAAFVAVSFSCIQDDDPNDASIPFGGAANGNIDDDPSFAGDPTPGPDGQWDGVDDDYGDLSLLDDSPCIDAANDMSVPPDVADLDGDSDTTERTPLDIVSGLRFVDHPETANTGVPDPPDYPGIADMGAQEHQLVIPPGDLDGDGDVDLADYGILAGCLVGPFAATAADYDDDRDVDLDDFDALVACVTGPDVVAGGGCAIIDVDHDNDVDLADYALFQNGFTGPDGLVPPDCAAADLDADNDVDLDDFNQFAELFPG